MNWGRRLVGLDGPGRPKESYMQRSTRGLLDVAFMYVCSRIRVKAGDDDWWTGFLVQSSGEFLYNRLWSNRLMERLTGMGWRSREKQKENMHFGTRMGVVRKWGNEERWRWGNEPGWYHFEVVNVGKLSVVLEGALREYAV
jgi:hypothetical protein